MRIGSTFAIAFFLVACGTQQPASNLKDDIHITPSPFLKAPIAPNKMAIIGDKITLGGPGSFAFSTDRGQTWATELPYKNDFWGGEGGRLRIAGNKVFRLSDNDLYVSDLTATKFQKVKSEGYCPTYNVVPVDDGGVAFASSCGLLISYDNGRTFYKKGYKQGLPGEWVKNVVTFEGKIFAAAGDGFKSVLSVSLDQGENFTSKSTYENDAIFPYLGVNDRGVYFANMHGLYITNDGQTFKVVSDKRFFSFAVSGDTIVASDENGDIHVSNDAGTSWKITKKFPESGDYRPNAIVIDGLNIYFDGFSNVSKAAVFVYSNDGGKTFKARTFQPVAGVSTYIEDIALVVGELFVLTSNGTYISGNGLNGNSFERLDTGVDITRINDMVHFGDTIFVEASCNNFNDKCVFVSNDGGLSYSYLWNSRSLSLTQLAYSGSNIHAIAGGHLSYSTDGGETFIKSVVPNTYRAHDRDLLQASGNFVLLKSFSGLLYYSTNGGKRYGTWDNSNIQTGPVTWLSLDGNKVYIGSTNGIYLWDLETNETSMKIPVSSLPVVDSISGWVQGDKLVIASRYSESLFVSVDGGITFRDYEKTWSGPRFVQFLDDTIYYADGLNIFRI